MKLPFKIYIDREGFDIQYGRSPVAPDIFFYYWGIDWWNVDRLRKDKWFGGSRIWYDGPHVAIWCKPFTLSWSSPWTTPPKEFRK